MRDSLSAPAGGGRRRTGTADFGTALAGLAMALRREQQHPAVSRAIIARAATEVIPGASSAAVTVPVADGISHARAVTGDLAAAVLGVQDETRQGPAWESGSPDSAVLISDMTAGDRWPLFRDRAAAIGAGSMICAPMTDGIAVRGSLSVISPQAGAFDEESADLAAVFAVHAAIALSAAESYRQLQAAVSSRDVIGQAKGILMQRYKITADAAFMLMSAHARESNAKLRDVAWELCQTGGLAWPRRAHRLPGPPGG